MKTEKYILCGKEWEAELNKHTKAELISMIRELQTGTKDKKLCGIQTAKEAQHMVEGIINDFEAGISTKEETMELLGSYTARLMDLFWKNAKKIFVNNPELTL